MYKELVIRNILITALSLLVFFMLSLVVINDVNNRNTRSELISLSEILSNAIKETSSESEMRSVVNKFTDSQEWFSVVVATSNGDIVIDSREDDLPDGLYKSLDSSELKKISDTTGKGTVYTNGSRIYYISKLNDDIIFRTSMAIESNINYVLWGMFILITVLTVVLAINIWLTGKSSKNITDAFENISDNLKTTARGEYKEIDTEHKYEEVSKAYRHLNEVTRSIFLYILQIKAERDKLNHIISNINEGIIIISENKVYAINDCALEIFGAEKTAEYNCYEDIIKDQKFVKMIKNEQKTRTPIAFDYTDKRSEKIYYVNLNYFKNSEHIDEKDLVSVVLYDVTALRKEERMKADFVANASHELKTPITSISGFSELILSGLVSNDEDIKKYVANIHTEAIKMKQTVEALLLLSKLDNADELVDVNTVDLLDVVSESLEKFNKVAAEKGIKCFFIGNNTPIKGNYTMLVHLVSNLLDNAIKYNHVGGEVVVGIGENNKGCKFLTVSDTGIGIAPQHIDKLYDRFFRCDDSHNKNEGGTGLGLTIVHKICELHNADIQVKSQYGKCTVFTVCFKKEENND